MSENSTTTPTAATVRPIPSTASAVETKPETHICTRCRNPFQAGTGRVPELTELYIKIRHVEPADVTTLEGRKYMWRNPLTCEEVLSQELCRTCARLATFKTHMTSDTLCILEGWRLRNKEWAEKRAAKRAEENRQRQNAALFVSAGAPRKVLERVSDDPVSLARAIKTEDKHKINEIISEGGRPYHSHKPQRKRSKEPRHQRVQSEEPSNKKGGKGKKDKNSQKKGGKGRK